MEAGGVLILQESYAKIKAGTFYNYSLANDEV